MQSFIVFPRMNSLSCRLSVWVSPIPSLKVEPWILAFSYLGSAFEPLGSSRYSRYLWILWFNLVENLRLLKMFRGQLCFHDLPCVFQVSISLQLQLIA